MMRGRKPKPTALHSLHGTYNVTRHAGRKHEPAAVGDLLSEPPPWMTDDQQASWRYAIENAPRDVLKRIDRAVLAVWIEAECRHRLAAQSQARLDVGSKLPLLTKGPKGEPMVSPYIGIMNAAAQIMLRAGSELGFSPASRPRVGGGGGDGGKVDEDEVSTPWGALRAIPGGKA